MNEKKEDIKIQNEQQENKKELNPLKCIRLRYETMAHKKNTVNDSNDLKSEWICSCFQWSLDTTHKTDPCYYDCVIKYALKKITFLVLNE